MIKKQIRKYCPYFPFTDCRIYFSSTFLIATEIAQQPRTYTVACDCKYPTCTWRVSCLIKISSINPKGQGDFRIYRRTFSCHDIIEMPTMTSPLGSIYGTTYRNGNHYSKSSRSKSHPQEKDITRLKKVNTYKRGIYHI